MGKIPINDAKRTTTMFLNSPQIEEYFKTQVDYLTAKYSEWLSRLNTLQGMKDFIREEKKSIDMIQTLLGISNEKFKRVVSTVRLRQGFVFDSEISGSTLRNNMLSTPWLMETLCNLFVNGRNTPEFQEYIPAFILDEFCIDSEYISNIANANTLRSKIKDSFATEYNSKYCDFYEEQMTESISEIAAKYGLSFNRTIEITELKNKLKQKKSSSDGLVKGIQYNGKTLFIEYQYNTTTSSGQTSYYNDVVGVIYDHCFNNADLHLLCCLDGAGWIGRSADYNKIYNDCHYFLNLQSINKLELIITEFFKI